MDAAMLYPKRFRNSIRRLENEIGASADMAYSMLIMTAMLMDLKPEDEQTLHIILQDCGIEDGEEL